MVSMMLLLMRSRLLCSILLSQAAAADRFQCALHTLRTLHKVVVGSCRAILGGHLRASWAIYGS